MKGTRTQEELEKLLPEIANESFEKMTVEGIELTGESSLKELRTGTSNCYGSG